MIRTPATLSAVALAAALLPPAPGFAGEAAAQTNPPATAKATDKIAELFGDDVVARGKGIEIKRSQLDSAMISLKGSAAARNQPLAPEQMRLLEQQILERIIQINLLVRKATDADKAKGKETAEKRFDVVLKRAGSDEALNRQLKSVGLGREELLSKMTEEAVAEAVIERELNVNITDADAKKYYEDFPARFEQSEMVRASHILLAISDPAKGQELSAEQKLAKRKLAEDLLKRARAGEDFAQLARTYSDDNGSKENGGEYTFPRGKMVTEFETAAFSLNTNQVSDIVTTQFGYHIIKLSQKIPSQKVELAKVSDDVKQFLKQQQVEKLLPEYIEKQRKEAGVEILDEKLKPKAPAASPAPAFSLPQKTDEKKPEVKK